MKVKPIDGDRAGGERMLAVVVQHAPADVVSERSWASEASEGRLMDAEGDVWFVTEGGLSVQRLHFIADPGTHAELTTYQDGREVSREVAPTS